MVHIIREKNQNSTYVDFLIETEDNRFCRIKHSNLDLYYIYTKNEKMLELLSIKQEESHVRLVILPSFFCGKYYKQIPFVAYTSQYNRKTYMYLSLCLYNDKLCYLIYGKQIMDFLTPKPNINKINKIPYGVSFDVTLKTMPNYMKLNAYENFVDISNEYDKQYLTNLLHSVDVNDSIKLVYEKLVKNNYLSDPSVQQQLAEFKAIEREYKLKQLIDNF